jgi:hypothetical protein
LWEPKAINLYQAKHVVCQGSVLLEALFLYTDVLPLTFEYTVSYPNQCKSNTQVYTQNLENGTNTSSNQILILWI